MGNPRDRKSLGQGRLRLEGWPVCPLGWKGQGMRVGPNSVCYGAAVGLYRLLIKIQLQNRGDHGGSCTQGCRHQGLGRAKGMSLEHMALPFCALSRVQGLFVCRAVSNGTNPPFSSSCMMKALPGEPLRALQPPWAEGVLCMPGPVPSEVKSCLL